MVLDGIRGYLQLASGLTDVTRERAVATAKTLVAQGEAGVDAVLPGPVRSQVSSLAEDLLATSRSNRDLLKVLVRGEVERSVQRLGLVSAHDLEASVRRSRGLERRVAELEDELTRTAATTTAKRTAGAKSAATQPTARKTAATKSTATGATAKKPVARKTAATKSPATGATAKKPVARKTAATKSPATGATAKKSTARKTAATKSTARKEAATKTAARRSTA